MEAPRHRHPFALAALALLVFFASCDRQDDIETAPAAGAIETGAEPSSGGLYSANHFNSPLLVSILPDYEDLTGKKILLPDSITDQITMTIQSGGNMSLTEIVELYESRFRHYGYEMLPVDETTVKFAAIAGQDQTSSTDPDENRRRLVIRAPVEEAGDEVFTATHIQAPLVSDIIPAYAELAGKRIVLDNQITEAITMTINTAQKMSKEVALDFYEDTFEINGFQLVPVDDETLKFVAIEPPVGQ